MMGLTKRQSDALGFIRTYREANGIMPSYREIAKGIGLASPGRVYTLVDGLIDRGALRRMGRQARAIELVEPENMQAILLNKEIYGLLRAYAAGERITVDTAASALLRDALGAA